LLSYSNSPNNTVFKYIVKDNNDAEYLKNAIKTITNKPYAVFDEKKLIDGIEIIFVSTKLPENIEKELENLQNNRIKLLKVPQSTSKADFNFPLKRPK
jgi:vacuolar-type H+-ATPase subunit F/Vma7